MEKKKTKRIIAVSLMTMLGSSIIIIDRNTKEAEAAGMMRSIAGGIRSMGNGVRRMFGTTSVSSNLTKPSTSGVRTRSNHTSMYQDVSEPNFQPTSRMEANNTSFVTTKVTKSGGGLSEVVSKQGITAKVKVDGMFGETSEGQGVVLKPGEKLPRYPKGFGTDELVLQRDRYGNLMYNFRANSAPASVASSRNSSLGSSSGASVVNSSVRVSEPSSLGNSAVRAKPTINNGVKPSKKQPNKKTSVGVSAVSGSALKNEVSSAKGKTKKSRAVKSSGVTTPQVKPASSTSQVKSTSTTNKLSERKMEMVAGDWVIIDNNAKKKRRMAQTFYN